MLILELSTMFQMLHYISIEEVSVWLCTSFLAVVEIQCMVSSCVVFCTKEGVSCFIHKRRWGDARRD